MFNLCVMCACSSIRPHRLCPSCQAELEQRRILQPNALYEYSGIVRELIHRAKIAGDHQALRLIVHLFASDSGVLKAARRATHVMPAASSLWGRLRGRFDIAAIVADTLVRATHRRYLNPPRELRWRWRKRAAIPRDLREQSVGEIYALAPHGRESSVEQEREESAEPGIRILLIDDVCTTGETIRTVIDAIHQHHAGAAPPQVTWITFASAIDLSRAGNDTAQVDLVTVTESPT